MILVMGNERVEVASAFISDDEQTVTGYGEDGERLVLLEGVNFDNVWLEDDQGQRIEFPKKPDTNQEIEEMRRQIKELAEMLQQIQSKEVEA